MAAVAAVPGLSTLLAWPTEHLADAAVHWENVGERSCGVVHQIWRDALAVDWHGEAAEKLRSATHADLQTTNVAVDQLQAAARVARNGASDLYAARSRVHYAVEDARTAGFEVGEDLSVTDRMTGGSVVQRAARQAAAQTVAGDIRQRAAQLVSLDQTSRRQNHCRRGRNTRHLPAKLRPCRFSASTQRPHASCRPHLETRRWQRPIGSAAPSSSRPRVAARGRSSTGRWFPDARRGQPPQRTKCRRPKSVG
jgi:hypothetical protein